MRWKTCVIALSIAATATLAACTSESTGMSAPSFLRAAIAGSVQAQYSGSGTFRVLPEGVRGPRFDLHSQGVGESTNQGFAFHAVQVPTPGEHPLGELDEDTFRAIYWYDEGNERKIFRARSGTVLISESTPKRVAGTFRLVASLVRDCTLEPGFPGQFLKCKPAQEEASVEIAGSFDAGPLGGDSPGLIPSP